MLMYEMHSHKKLEIYVTTYNIANFLGFSERTGNSAKQSTKQARAPRLQPANIRIRSHLLTRVSSQCLDVLGLIRDKNPATLLLVHCCE